MNAKYSIPQYIIIATLVAVAVLVLPTACHDELGYPSFEGQRITFKLTAPDTWHKGISVNESAPTTHCTSVRALSGGDTKLYLHTVVADNPVKEKTAVTRGTPVKNTEAFQTTYPRFSLSGICYTGEYPKEESDNPWTTEYAYNLYYNSATGVAETEGGKLLWPSNGNVRFFAFAPTVEDFSKSETGGTLALSDADHKGSPTLTYTVPTDVTKQVDLMTVCADISATTTPQVELTFGHALTAVQIKCGKDMLAGKITKVTIAGIHGKGTQVIGADTWTPSDEEDKATYTISKEITLSPGKDSTDQIHVPEGTPITGTDTTENLTFMLLPQTLPDGATMTIEFTDAATQTPRTLKGSIAGHTWEAGKIVTYTVSPSSIHISHKFEFNKKGATENTTGDTIPYSGVWYDATYSAQVEVTQEGVAPKTIDIPAEKVKLQYSFNNSNWTPCEKDSNGLLVIAAQDAYTEMNSKFVNKESEVGSKDSPFSLSSEYSETANCYLVDQAGYYSLSLVYGNGNVSLPTGNTDGFKYFPKHDDATIPADGKISKSDAHDAVLCWQDAPDLIDPDSVEVKDGENLVFHIRKHTLAQGNALLAVRNASKQIIWSWHIWVTPYKNDFYDESKHYHSQTYNDKTLLGEYYFAQYNLGWCDNHAHNVSRTFRLQAVIDMSAYGGNNTTTVDIPGTFTQMEFKGSDAGDNTYYQWGRKDPMLGGIYNDNTPKYKYKKKGTTEDGDEFTMENKQVFNQYNQDDYNYSFCKNLGDGIAINDYASNGVTIGYSIQHPYMFITNSRCNDGGDTPTPAFNYRNHWHKPYAESPVGYLNAGTHIMFNAWDAGATNAGYAYDTVFTNANNIKAERLEEYLNSNAADVKKSVYDPCPPKFKVPPIDAFRGIAKAYRSNNGDYGLGKKTLSDNAWTITYNGQTIKFPLTGVRDYALRNNEWRTVTPLTVSHEDFYKISMPAFKMLSFVSSATIVKKEAYNAYQLLILAIDKDRKQPSSDTNIKISCYTTSSNSYGLPVRPIRDIPNKK